MQSAAATDSVAGDVHSIAPESTPSAAPENTVETPAESSAGLPEKEAAVTLPDTDRFTTLSEEVRRKYANAAPHEWGEHTAGVIRKVNIPTSDTATCPLFLTVNVYYHHSEAIFDLLNEHHIKATVFVSGYYAQEYGEAVQRIAKNPLFDIGNLGYRCRPVSTNGASAYHLAGTVNIGEALYEVTAGAQAIAQATGTLPAFFRPATGYIDEVAVKAIKELGVQVVGYESVTDGGGTSGAEIIKERILSASAGSIIVVSINPNYPHVVRGLEAAIKEIETRHLPVHFEKLADYSHAFDAY
jgi:peptidoglycan/xylan/chitin deacetylase (PgdA/CDA1 family)